MIDYALIFRQGGAIKTGIVSIITMCSIAGSIFIAVKTDWRGNITILNLFFGKVVVHTKNLVIKSSTNQLKIQFVIAFVFFVLSKPIVHYYKIF